MDNYSNRFSFTKTELRSRLPEFEKETYVIESGLYQAVKVALLLKQPLLLTGKPGTGKTLLAHKLAADLHTEFGARFISEPLVFITKTTSSYTDLFYTYDALSHFHAVNVSQSEQKPDVSGFIQLQALGQAIILSNKKSARSYKPIPALEKLDVSLEGLPYSSVVLIDEVDKAPRDFTNDLLNELEQLEFTVKEDEYSNYKVGTGNIFIILTSNSEKNLPDSFLRRCVFYHIDFPGEEVLEQIVMKRIFYGNPIEGDVEKISNALKSYLAFYSRIKTKRLKKDPATAELISWVFYLYNFIVRGILWEEVQVENRIASLSILTKHPEDYSLLKSEIM